MERRTNGKEGKERKGEERKAVSSIPFERKFVERESKSSRERARVSKRSELGYT